MVELKSVDSGNTKHDSAYIDMANQDLVFDRFITKHTQLIRNNSVANTILLNVVILTLTVISNINLTAFLTVLAVLINLLTKAKTSIFEDRTPTFYFLIMSLISYFFFSFGI